MINLDVTIIINMDKIERFFRERKQLSYVDNKKCVEINTFIPYLGHENIFNFTCDLVFSGGQTYVTLENAQNLMKTLYNKNNVNVVQYHKEMGIVGMEYTLSAKTFSPVANAFGKVGSMIESVAINVDNSVKNKTSQFSLW